MAQESQPLSDEELARMTQAGSLESFEELVRRYESRVFGFLVRFRLGHADAGVVVQDTFVRAFQAIDRFNLQHKFAPWLFTIARHKAIDHLRARRPPPDAAPLPEPHDLNDPAALLTRTEERQALWQLAERLLPEPQFQALWLRYVVDLDIAGIAEVVGRTQTGVKVLLFRARRSLGEELNAQRAVESPAAKPPAPAFKLNSGSPVERARLSRVEP